MTTAEILIKMGRIKLEQTEEGLVKFSDFLDELTEEEKSRLIIFFNGMSRVLKPSKY